MQSNLLEHTEAVRKYYAAFPALKKGQDSPEQYYLPPPAWCRRPAPTSQVNMQNELLITKDWNSKSKKYSSGKERRNSYHGQRKTSKKRCHTYSRSFESKENLPEWVTHEGVWDMDTQDPVREFIRAIALDEGYGTCENTVTDDLHEMTNIKMKEPMVPDWDNSLDMDTDWIIREDLNPRVRTPMEEELYAKFEAKFDRSIEALWSKDQANTPDDEYQDLPIDFQDLLSSPSDHRFFEPPIEKCSMISLTESIWSNDAFDSFLGNSNRHIESPTKSVETLHDRFKPLNLADDLSSHQPEPPTRAEEHFSLYQYEDIYDAVPSVEDVMYSLILLNHSKNHSSFTEVIPRRFAERSEAQDGAGAAEDCAPAPMRPPDSDREDLLTSTRTHFRPIRREADVGLSNVRYADGATFHIRSDVEPVEYTRSESGYLYLESEAEASSERPQRYLEYRVAEAIDYGRMNLTAAQRAGGDLDDYPTVYLKFAVKAVEKAVQTEEPSTDPATAAAAWGLCDGCARRVGAKKKRPTGVDSIWSAESGGCGVCAAHAEPPPPLSSLSPAEEWSRDWEELLSDISAAHAQYLGTGGPAAGEGGEEGWWRGDRKRRHSAALRCVRAHGPCSHPHAPFLYCCALDRPLTR